MTVSKIPLLACACVALLFVFCYSTAYAAQTTKILGIHIHKEGTSPYFANSAKVQLKAAKEQCEGLQAMCKQGLGSPVICPMVAAGFKFSGDISSAGNYQTDEYFAVSEQMKAQWRTTKVMEVKSICEIEMSELKSAKIRHYKPSGRTQYELKHNKKKGAYWLRTEHEALSTKTASLLLGVFPPTAGATVTPVLRTEKYAGHHCEVRDVSGPLAGNVCLMTTGVSFPGYVALAGTLQIGEDIMEDDRATQVTTNIALPTRHFNPPKDEKIVTSGDNTGRQNATQRWCLAQKAKTGVNPCEKDADDK